MNDEIKKELESVERSAALLESYNECLARHFKYQKLGTALYVAQVVLTIGVACLVGLLLTNTPETQAGFVWASVGCGLTSLALFACLWLSRSFDRMAKRSYLRAIGYDREFRLELQSHEGLKCSVCGKSDSILRARSDTGKLICDDCWRMFAGAVNGGEQ